MENSNSKYLINLNKNQKNAVLDIDGPCLIVAGAGSGKTKVLTTRVAHLIKEKKAWSNQILCVPFTNKAAREMRTRMERLVGPRIESLTVGTFHSFCARLLRMEGS